MGQKGSSSPPFPDAAESRRGTGALASRAGAAPPSAVESAGSKGSRRAARTLRGRSRRRRRANRDRGVAIISPRLPRTRKPPSPCFLLLGLCRPTILHASNGMLAAAPGWESPAHETCEPGACSPANLAWLARDRERRVPAPTRQVGRAARGAPCFSLRDSGHTIHPYSETRGPLNRIKCQHMSRTGAERSSARSQRGGDA